MKEYSILIGGKAGFGIDRAGSLIAGILSQLGWRIYIYRDYPSLIRGGHTFSIIRLSEEKINTHKNQVDFLLALNQDAINLNKHSLKGDSVIIYDSDTVKIEGLSQAAVAVPLGSILKEEKAPEIMRNTCLIGGLCKAAGIKWEILEKVFKKNIAREIEQNLKVAKKGYDSAKELRRIEVINQKNLPILLGSEAMGLGLIKAGLKTYIAYPMTPSSGLLHYLANIAEEFSLKVIHPESEIGVILMALGFSYAGEKTAVGTSGGGFCLMTEGLSFAGMSELPLVVMVGQRPGPSTGLPTYTSQTELLFAISAGQGEFTRLVVAPGDTEEAYFWSGVSLNMAWKYQIPAIILTDKTLNEGAYSFDIETIEEFKEETPILWDKKIPYKRYLNTETGISPLAFIPEKDAVIKVNSYEHDEFGITAEAAQLAVQMQDKRLRKEKYLSEELIRFKPVRVYGNDESKVGLLCWGSNKGVCTEAAENLGIKVIQPIVLWPFPKEEFKAAISSVDQLISVENNATAQFAKLIRGFGFTVSRSLLKYDGRPFSLDELVEKLKAFL